mgnify:CR=1 FL=1
MNVPPISDSRTVDLKYEGDHLISVVMDNDRYEVSGCQYERSIVTNGKLKRLVAAYSSPIALCYTPESSRTPYYTVSVVGTKEMAVKRVWSFESINGIISFYDIDSNLLETMIAKMGW